MIITTIAICGRFCSPEGVINGSCLNYGSFLAGLCPKSRAQRARAPRLPRFILLVGFGGMAYDSYLVAAFPVRGGLAGGGVIIGSCGGGGCIRGWVLGAWAPCLPGFILLVGFGGVAYDPYLVAAFAVLGEGGGGVISGSCGGGGAISGVGCPARGRLAFRGLCCWWASVAWSVVAVCGSGEGGGVSGWIINSSCGEAVSKVQALSSKVYPAGEIQ